MKGTLLLLPLALLACKDRRADDSSDAPVTPPCEVVDWAGDLSSADWEGPTQGPGGDIRYFAQSEAAPERIYAGSTLNGLFRSDDGGLTWQRKPTPRSHILGEMSTLPDDPDTLLMTSEELWRTTDGGDTWEAIEELGGTNPEQGVRASLYADGRLWAIEGTGDLHVSDDGGASFTYAGTAAFPDPPPHNALGSQEWQWQLAASGDGTIYAIFDGMGILATDDGGETWRDVWFGKVNAGTLAAEGDRVWFTELDLLFESETRGRTSREIGVVGEDVARILPDGSGGIYLAKDGQVLSGPADALEPLGPESPHHLQGLARLPDGRLYVGHSEGISELSEAQGYVDRSEGVEDNDLAVLLAHPLCPDAVFVGTQCQRGLYRSDDWGAGLTHIDQYMHYVMVARANPRRPEELWVTNDNQLLMSPDMGVTWREVTAGVLDYHMHGLDLDPRDPDHVLVGSVGSGIWGDDSGRVYQSFDAGQTWDAAGEGLPQTQASAHAIHFVQSAEGVVLLGTFKGDDISHAMGSGEGMFRSTDNGSTWSAVDLGGARDVAKIAECDEQLYATADLGVVRSTDAGETWSEVLDRPTLFVALACHGQTVLAMDLERQVHRSDDGGDTWVNYSGQLGVSPLGNQMLHDLAITADGEVALLAVRGEGLYRRALR